MTSLYAGHCQTDMRDLGGNALVTALIEVRLAGSATPATLFNNAVLIAAAEDSDSLGNSHVPAAAGEGLPGVDLGGVLSFYADASQEYDIVGTSGTDIIGPFRVRLKPDSREPAPAWRGVDDNSPIIAKPAGDTRSGVIDLRSESDVGYLIHLGNLGAAGGSAIGIGVGAPSVPVGGAGLVVDNYSTGIGIFVQQTPSITDDGAYGIYGDQRSNLAPLMRLQALPGDAAPLAQFVGPPLDDETPGPMVEFYIGAGSLLAGYVDGADGAFVWRSPIAVESGAPVFRVENTVSEHEVRFDTGAGARMLLYEFSGSPNQWWAQQLIASADHLLVQTAAGAAAKGAETMATVIDVQNGNLLGFHGHAATAQAAHPTTLGDVITILTNKGLCAA